MRSVPIVSNEEAAAVQHAINVHIDHYHDIDEDDNAETLRDALNSVHEDQVIPADAVSLVWEILVEHDHFAIAMQSDYNGGEDGPYLLNVLTSIVAFNGDHLFETYEQFRERADVSVAQ